MKWYKRVTEAAWFKRALDPEAPGVHGKASRLLAVTIGAGLLLFTTGHVVLSKHAARDPEHVCASDPLRAAYKPSRLEVIATCEYVSGTVTHVASERDGDLHIRFAAGPKWLTQANAERQHGDLVVEYMPGDPWERPRKGDQYKLLCTIVADHDHGWRAPSGKVFYWQECHPVWGVVPLGKTASEPVP